MVSHMKVLDLFSGIGGFSLGLERAGMETVAFCEYDEKCRQVLKKHWPEVPQYNDVRTLTAEKLKNDGITNVDVLTGGYPCQPFSLAGVRKGEDDDRHLWPEVKRLIQELKPTWVCCENVAGHISMGLDSVLADLETEGYQSQVFVIPACAVGAHHRRDRVWILATNSESFGGDRASNGSGEEDKGSNGDKAQQSSEHGEIRPMGNSDHDGTPTGRNKRKLQGGQNRKEVEKQQSQGSSNKRSKDVADPLRERQQGQRLDERSVYSAQDQTREANRINGSGEGRRESRNGDSESRLGRSSDGISAWLDGSWEDGIPRVSKSGKGRADRLKQLGNSVVPQIPEIIGRAIMEASA